MERRLAAIFAADVAGYSRLIGADEEGTLERLKAHRRELIDPKIAEHQGRIVKTTGDGVLVEFASPVKAVRCAIDVQHGMANRNADVPEGHRIEFRIGINLGDVSAQGGCGSLELTAAQGDWRRSRACCFRSRCAARRRSRRSRRRDREESAAPPTARRISDPGRPR
jgi:class 3 adenylate cyclase